jgi:hypothetical protein
LKNPPAHAQNSLDDYPIAVIPKVPMWSENYAYMVNDVANRLAIVCLLGRWTADPRIWREFLMIGLPGERVVYHKAFGRAATKTVAAASLLRVEVVEPEREFQIRFDGPMAEDTRAALLQRGTTARPVQRCQFDFRMRGDAPVWDISGHKNDASDIAGKMHVEQVGTVNGSLTYGAETFKIEQAFGQRDHSRGIRIVTTFYRHCWAQGHFRLAGVTFNLYAMAVHGGTPMMHATVSRGEHRYPATVQELDFMDGPQDGNVLYGFKLHSELGEMAIKMTEVIVSLPKGFTSPWDVNVGAIPGHHFAMVYEEAVTWDWAGERGSGWSERGFNPQPFPT